MTRKPLFLLATIAAAGCLPVKRADDTSHDHWLMQSYDVPPDEATSLLAHLKDLFILSKGDGKGESSYTQLARAAISPDGRLVVVGDREIQDGVKELIAGMANHPAAKTRTVHTGYWLVTGKPAKGETVIPAELNPVSEALQEIEKQTGPQEFALWEELHITSSGTSAKLNGRHTTIAQEALTTAGGDRVLLNTKLNASRLGAHMNGPNDVETHIEVAPDQTVVLAQTGFNPAEPLDSPSGNTPPVTLYYLVKASVRNGG